MLWELRDHPISPPPQVTHILLLESTWPRLLGKDPEEVSRPSRLAIITWLSLQIKNSMKFSLKPTFP